MENVINDKIQEAKFETERRSQEIETMDDYLDKANEIKKALLDLIKIYDRLNKALTRSINNEEISITQENANELEDASKALATESYHILDRIEKSRFSKAVNTEIDEFKDQIEELKEIAEDFKSSLRLSNDQDIQSLLS